MPLPRWTKPPSRRDPSYRKLDDRYTLGANFMLFSTFTLTLWFLELLWQVEWSWLKPVVFTWMAVVVVNGVWVLAIARYPGAEENSSGKDDAISATPESVSRLGQPE